MRHKSAVAFHPCRLRRQLDVTEAHQFHGQPLRNIVALQKCFLCVTKRVVRNVIFCLAVRSKSSYEKNEAEGRRKSRDNQGRIPQSYQKQLLTKKAWKASRQLQLLILRTIVPTSVRGPVVEMDRIRIRQISASRLYLKKPELEIDELHPRRPHSSSRPIFIGVL